MEQIELLLGKVLVIRKMSFRTRKVRDIIGVEWDESKSSSALSRIDAYGKKIRVAPFSFDSHPVWGHMKRCLLNDSGEVVYYLDSSDSNKKIDGSAANLDGTDGQVMVEIPKFYYRHTYAGTIHTWQVSSIPRSGFSVHNAFIKNGETVNHRYIGAYEGVLYDDSLSDYTNGLQLTADSTTFTLSTGVISRIGESHPFTSLEVGNKIVIAGTTNNNGTFTIATGGTGNQSITVDEALVDETAASTTIETEKNFTNDKLSSISDKVPINDGTRANFRALADKRGTGWRQQDFDLVSAIQLLYIIEYANWNSQTEIGNGLTDWVSATWDGWNDYNPIEKTGNSNSNGNATANNSTGSGNTSSYMSYRGIENFFGHIWKWIDGFNINDNIPYVCNNDTNFADDTTTNYTSLGVTLATSNDYVITFESIARGFLAASVGGSSTTYVTDYYYQNTGWRVTKLGGDADSGPLTGVACWSLNDSLGYLDRSVGGRLAF